MAAVSMHKAFEGMNRRLSPALRTLAPLLRQRHFEVEKLRELARSDEFTDSESDGVSESEEETVVVPDTMFTPNDRTSPKRKTLVVQQRLLIKQQQQKSIEKTSSSPNGDEWEMVDKSPTFENIADGKIELEGEKWFVPDREH